MENSVDLNEKKKEYLKAEQNRVAKTYISAFIATSVFVVPLTIWPFFTQRYFFPKMVMLYIFGFILLAMMPLLKDKEAFRRYIKDGAAISLIVFILSTTITLFYSINIKLSLFGSFERRETYFIFLVYFLFFTATFLGYEYKKWHLILFALMISLVAIYALFQLGGIEIGDLFPFSKYQVHESWKYKAFSTLGNPNFLASMMAMAFPILFFVFVDSKKPIWLLPLSLNYFVLLATRTRGSWIAVFLIFILMTIVMLKNKYSLKMILIVLLVLLVLTLFYSLLFENLFVRIGSAFKTIGTVINPKDEKELMNAGSSRIAIWKAVLMLIKKKPLTGYGIETLAQAVKEDTEIYSFLQKFGPNLVNVDKAHNEFLNIWVSSGLVAGFSYLSFAFFVFLKGVRNIRYEKMIIPLLGAFLAYFMQAMFNISNNGIAFIFYIIAGIILSLCQRKDNRSKDLKVIYGKNEIK